MDDILPRLKPDPVPAIHPIPEYAAVGQVAEIYDRTRRGLNVPWMGVVAMAFAHYPRFYGCLWSALEPIAASARFTEACRELRQTAEAEAAALEPPSIVGRLEELGYGLREIDEIRACNEVFSAGNMPYILMASIARRLLEEQEWSSDGTVTSSDQSSVEANPRPILIEAHHADPTVKAVYRDIQATLGLPFVNTDYRAFARWPSYMIAGWNDLKPAIKSPDYEPAVDRVHTKAMELATSLPNTAGVTPRELRSAARQDAPEGDVLEVVRLFQWLLPGLATNVAFLRAQLQTTGPSL